MPSATLTVQSVSPVRKGQGQYGPWTMSKVVATDGKDYTTFNGEKYKPGQTYTVEFEESQSGKFTNRRLKDSQKKGGQTTEILARLETKLDRLLVLAGDARPPQ